MSGDTEVPNLKPQESESAGITESGEGKGKKIKKNFCYVCGVQCTAKKNFLAHQEGKKHLKKLGTLQEAKKQKQSLNEKQELKQKQSLNKKQELKQKQSLNKKQELKQKPKRPNELKQKQGLNKKQGFKQKQTLNKKQEFFQKQSLDKNKNNCKKINSNLDNSHETHEKNSSILELSEATDIVSETEPPSPNKAMNNPRRNSQKYQNHNHNDPGYQNNYNHRRYHNPRYSYYNNDYYHGNQGFFYNQPPGHSRWQGAPFPNGPYGYQGNGSNMPFNSGPFPESNLPFDSRQFQGSNISFDPGNSTQPYSSSGNAFSHSGNEIMQEQMTYNQNSTPVRNGNKSRSKEKGSFQDDNLADGNSSRNELNKSRDGYDLNSSTSTVENDTNPAATKANEGGEERLQTSPLGSSDSIRHKMSRWDKEGTKDKSERKSMGSSDSVRRRKTRWDKSGNGERKSVDSDSASEEQRVKEYTTSLLETNPSRLSQLIQHPSNYKEKAVLNHIITSFSKTKRKESLTRKLRSNSLGSIGNNEDIALDTTSVMSENDEITKTTPLLETLGLMSSDLDRNARKISPRKSRDCSKESNSESALNNEAPNNSSSPLPVSIDARAKNLRKSSSKSKENSTSKSKTYENRKEQTPECYVPDKLVKRKSSDCDSSIKSKKQKQVNEGVSVPPNSSNVAEEADRDMMDTPADHPLDDLSNKQTSLEFNAEEVPVKAEIAEFLTIAHSIEMNNAANSLVETPANPQNEALNFSSPLSVEHLIELFASGSVTVKREFNDPVIEALKAVDPNELLNACSPNNTLSNKNAAENICTSADLNSRESELTSELTTTTRSETNSLNPVILGSVVDSDNITSVNVAARRNSGLSEKLLEKSKDPNSSSEQQSVDDALSQADTINLISKTKSEFPHLNKLIEDLLKISSEEEKVKENISEAKSKITEYSCLLEEWKNKKRKFHNEEEELRKKRNSIIQLMQNTMKQPSNPSNEPEPESQSKPISESPSLSGINKAKQKVDKVPKAKNIKKSSSSESPSLSGKNKVKQKVDKVSKAKNVEKSSSSSSSSSSTSSSSSESSSESSSPEKTRKKKKPNSSDSEEIVILPPPAKPNPPEIVIVDDTEETGIRHDALSSSNEGLSLFSAKKLNVHSTVVNSIVVFDDHVYTCSNDNTAKRFNLKDPSDTVTYFHTSKNVTEVVVEKVQNEALVFTSCSNKVLSLFIASNGTKIKTFFQVAVVQSICKGWGKFYAGLNDGTVNVYNWKYEEKEVVKSANPACRIATADQGRLHVLIILTSDGSVSLRDAETSLLIRCIKAYVKIPSWLTVHNDKAYLSSSDLSLFVVDVLSGKVEKKIYLNSHATGLAVSGDHIFNISYSGIINCINKDEITDKKLYYGAGKNGLTCIHIFQDWVFTGNRKGNISLFQFDPRSRADCRFNKCTYVFGSKEDLQFHVEKDHMLKKNLTRCYWANCPYVFPKGLTVQEKTHHMRGHFSATRNSASYEH